MKGKPYLTVLFSVLCLAALLAPAAVARDRLLPAAAPRGSTAPTGFLTGPLPDTAPASVKQMQVPPRFASYNAIEDEGQTTVVVPVVLKEYYGWNTLLSIQNLTTATMVITVEIHLEPVQTLTNSVPAHSPWNLRMVEIPELPVMMAAKATVSAPGSIAVTVVDEMPLSLTAYDGLFDAATELFVPVLYYDYFGWYSILAVQNAGVVTTTVTVSYSDGIVNIADIPPGEFEWFSQDSEGHAPGSTFSAVVSADQPLRGYSRFVHFVSPPFGESVQEAFTGIGYPVAVPLASKGYAGWDSRVVVQNVGSLTTNVTIAYQGYAGDAYSVTVGGGGTYVFSTTAEPFLPAGYHGAAQLSSDNGQPLVAQVLLWRAEPTASDNAATYNGVAVGIPGDAGGEEQLPAQPSLFRIHYPLAPKPASSAHDRWDAFLVVENVGTLAVSVTVEFYDANGATHLPADLGGFPNPFTLQAGASQVISMSAITEVGLPAGEDYAVVMYAAQPLAGVAVLGHIWQYRLFLPLVPKASQP